MPHPNSGAGHIKEDGHTDDFLYEVKDCMKTFRLVASELRTSHVRAIRQGRQAVWLVYFADQKFTAEIRLIPDGGRTVLDMEQEGQQ